MKCSASLTSKKIKIDWFKPEQEKPQQLKQKPQTQPQIQSENSETFVKTEQTENPAIVENVTNDAETSREIKDESVDDVLGEEGQEPGAGGDNDQQQTDVFQDLFAN